MEICIYSMAIGFIISVAIMGLMWSGIAYGKHLGRTEKKEKRTGV